MLKALLSSSIIIIFLACASCCIWHFFSSSQTFPSHEEQLGEKQANLSEGQNMLKSLANAAIIFSINHGGNGETNFPSEPCDLYPLIPDVYRNANVQCNKDKKNIGGYFWHISPCVKSNDFCFFLLVDEGYIGEELYIQKDLLIHSAKSDSMQVIHNPKEGENIIDSTQCATTSDEINQSEDESQKKWTDDVIQGEENIKKAGRIIAQYGEKVSDNISEIITTISSSTLKKEPEIQNTDESIVEKMFESFVNGITIYSIKNGGNGKAKFPIKAEQLERYIPRVYYQAMVIEGDLTSCVPMGGYIVSYQGNNDGLHFSLKVYPAPYYKGKRFEMTEDLKIMQQ